MSFFVRSDRQRLAAAVVRCIVLYQGSTAREPSYLFVAATAVRHSCVYPRNKDMLTLVAAVYLYDIAHDPIVDLAKWLRLERDHYRICFVIAVHVYGPSRIHWPPSARLGLNTSRELSVFFPLITSLTFSLNLNRTPKNNQSNITAILLNIVRYLPRPYARIEEI